MEGIKGRKEQRRAVRGWDTGGSTRTSSRSAAMTTESQRRGNNDTTPGIGARRDRRAEGKIRAAIIGERRRRESRHPPRYRVYNLHKRREGIE